MRLKNNVYSFEHSPEERDASREGRPYLQEIMKVLQAGPKPPRSNLTIAMVMMTPEKMKSLIAHTEKCGDIIQRRVYDKHRDDFKKIILDCGWHEVGTICLLDWAGCIMDSSHRLTAWSEIGISVPMVIIAGFNPEDFAYIDTGMQRTIANLFEMIGVDYRSGIMGSNTGGVVKFRTEFVPYGYPQHNRIPFTPRREVYEASKHVCEEAVNVYWQSRKIPGMTPRAAGTAYILVAMELGEEIARRFFCKLINARDLEKGSSIQRLRTKLSLETDYGGETLFFHQLAWLIKAFNCWHWKKRFVTIDDIDWERPERYPEVNVQ
jgi:hypothetical protein